MFLLKEPSNSSPPSEMPTSLRDYNGKKLILPSPKTGSPHTKLVLSLVREQEQRGKGALPSFALHLLSDQAGQSFTERNLPLYFWKRSLFRKKLHGNSFQRRSEKARCLLTQLYLFKNFLSSFSGILKLSRLQIYFVTPSTKHPRGTWQRLRTHKICEMPKSSSFTHLFNKSVLSTYLQVLCLVLGLHWGNKQT